MNIFNVETYISQVLEAAQPQPHRSKWSDEEDSIIVECIKNNLSLSDIHRIISLRSSGAIRTRANHLGYGFYRNKDDYLTYFREEINHKYRRNNAEILAGMEKVPIQSENSMVEHIEVIVDIVPKKVEIAVADLEMIMKILTAVKEQL